MATHKVSKSKSAKKKKVETPKKIPYYRKPDNLTLDQWQIALRKQFGQDNEFLITNIGQEKSSPIFRLRIMPLIIHIKLPSEVPTTPIIFVNASILKPIVWVFVSTSVLRCTI